MKLYKIWRRYGDISILELVWAENKDGVYSALSWSRQDNPRLEIEEITKRERCVLSISIPKRRIIWML